MPTAPRTFEIVGISGIFQRTGLMSIPYVVVSDGQDGRSCNRAKIIICA